MRHGLRCAVVIALLVPTSTSWAKPRIVIVATGGTIAAAQDNRTQAGYTREVELDDDKLGLIAAKDPNMQKARVLLRLGLTKATDPKRLRDGFYRH